MELGIKETLKGSIAGLFGGAIGYLLGGVATQILAVPDLQLIYMVLGFLGVFGMYALEQI